jgi:hypothetical protein
MGSITDNFANLSQVLLADSRSKTSSYREIVLNRLVKPLLPSAFRAGTGEIVDLKDRKLGPFDVLIGAESFPPLGEGMAQLFMADGVALCLQVRDWTQEDLTQFAEMAGRLKALVRKSKIPIYTAVIGFDSLPASQVNEFMKGSSGQSIDGVLSVGQHLILRNAQGWYGDPQKVRFVTQQGEGPALKSFAFWLLHIVHTFAGTSSPLADYQHL